MQTAYNEFSDDFPSLSGYELLVGFEFGVIVAYDIFAQTTVNIFNYDFDSHEAIIQKNVCQLIIVPQLNLSEQQTFIALFEDSTCLEYSINSESFDKEFLNEILNLSGTINIKESKSFQYSLREGYDLRVIIYKKEKFQGLVNSNGSCNFLSVEKLENHKKLNLNPISFCEFKANNITEMQILSHHNFKRFLRKKNKETLKQYQKRIQICKLPLIMVFSAMDGILRFFDWIQKQMLFALEFDSGIQSFTFNDDFNYLAIASQDDSTFVLNVNTFAGVQIFGHKSFVTSIAFYSQQEIILKILMSSMDSTISFFEIYMPEVDKILTESCMMFRSRKLSRQFLADQYQENCPVVARLQNFDFIKINLNQDQFIFKNEGNTNAIGMIKIINNLCAVSVMDGKIIFVKMDKYKNRKDVNEEQNQGFSFSFNNPNADIDESLKQLQKDYQEFQQQRIMREQNNQQKMLVNQNL